jgi:choline dehydrogenase-like flavoprotein
MSRRNGIRVLIDGRTLRERDATMVDLCVVGGGAAGLALALDLADAPLRVLVLERGGARAGRDYLYRVVDGPSASLTRDPELPGFVGGATNHWLGNCRPLDESDFERREWIPDSGWPIRRDELVPFYVRAQELCGLGDFRLYDVEACRPHLVHQPLDVKTSVLAHRVLQTCPEPRLAILHGRRIEDATGVRVATGTRAVELETNARGDTVTAARVVDAAGRRLRVTARVFVLAAGGIENPRLLLGSTGAHPAGLGNRHGQVGRFFMEHAHVDIPVDLARYGRDVTFHRSRQVVESALVWGQLTLSDDFMRGARVPGLALWFPVTDPSGPSVMAAIRLRNLLRGRGWPGSPLRDLRAVLRAPGAIARRAAGKLGRRAGSSRRAAADVLRVQMEQTPDARNRIQLATKRDAAGQRRATLALRVDDEHGRHARALAAAADSLGLDGPALAAAFSTRLRAGQVGFFSHHMGTTRMREDPREGAVDANGRVHGVSNLFVAGSSVFPTGGTAGPTLTIVALALRLARHLRERWQ